MTSPTNEQQRVDVLAVMDMLASADYGVSYSDAALQQQARQARAAVAELIEAASDLSKAVREETEHLRANNFANISQCDEQKKFESRVVEANERLCAALANVGAQK